MADLSALARVLRGELITPTNTDKFNEQRFEKTWTKEVALKNSPIAFAIVAGLHDLVRCVKFCSENNLAVTVRSKGGHSPWGIANDALCIDLQRMDGVRVDPSKKLAYIQAGATGRDVDDETSLHNLVCVTGSVSHTGFAGPCLGGGLGHLARWLGSICDSIIEYELVTAAGEVIRVNSSEHPDLYWALRGAGTGTYGIVTEFVIKLHDMPNNGMIYGAPILWALDKAEDVFPTYLKDICDPSRKNTDVRQFAFMFAPDGSEVCGVVPIIVGEKEEDAKAMCDVIASCAGGAAVRQDTTLPYVAMQQALDAMFPFGLSYYDKGTFIDYDPKDDDAIKDIANTIIQAWKNKPEESLKGHTIILCMETSGVVANADPSSTAFSARDSKLWVVPLPAWSEDGDYDAKSKACRAWCNSVVTKLAPYQKRNYINGAFPSTDKEMRNVYPGMEKLKVLKSKYDPEGLFTAGSWNMKLNV